MLEAASQCQCCGLMIQMENLKIMSQSGETHCTNDANCLCHLAPDPTLLLFEPALTGSPLRPVPAGPPLSPVPTRPLLSPIPYPGYHPAPT